jgi:uncharacterized membrane protein
MASFHALQPASGDDVSDVSSISGDGSTIVGTSNPMQSVPFAAYWKDPTTAVRLPTMADGFVASWASGVADDGSVIGGGGQDSSTAQVLFQWTAQSGMKSFGTNMNFQAPIANGMSGDGSTLVGSATTSTGVMVAIACTKTNGMTKLDDVPGYTTSSMASAVSDDGSAIVGNASSGTGNAPVLWVSGMTPIVLTDPAASDGTASAITRDGKTVFGVTTKISDGTNSAFRWTAAAGMTFFGDESSSIAAVSDDGMVAVGREIGTNHGAAVYDAAGVHDVLDLLDSAGVHDADGWMLGAVTGVSADGKTMVGYGTDPGGNSRGWVAVIP